MENEIIYLPSTRILILEKYLNFFRANFLGRIIDIKEAEKLGEVFPMEIKQILKDRNSARNKLEEIFQNYPGSSPMTSSLEYYFGKAGIPFTLAKRQEEKTQYLGLNYEEPINLEYENKRSIIPCRFYLIKDPLKLGISFKKISPISEFFPNRSEASDWICPLPTQENYHPQVLSCLSV